MFAHSAWCHFVSIRGVGRTDTEVQKSFMKKLLSAANEAQEKFEKEPHIRTIILADEFDGVAKEGSAITKDLTTFLETCSNDYH